MRRIQGIYHAYDMGAYEGETEHRFMFSFGSIWVDDSGRQDYRPGQSQSVLASEVSDYRRAIEGNYKEADVIYAR